MDIRIKSREELFLSNLRSKLNGVFQKTHRHEILINAKLSAELEPQRYETTDDSYTIDVSGTYTFIYNGISIEGYLSCRTSTTTGNALRSVSNKIHKNIKDTILMSCRQQIRTDCKDKGINFFESFISYTAKRRVLRTDPIINNAPEFDELNTIALLHELLPEQFSSSELKVLVDCLHDLGLFVYQDEHCTVIGRKLPVQDSRLVFVKRATGLISRPISEFQEMKCLERFELVKQLISG